ncbi:MAG: hypothetical protein QOJ07_3047 [Thermoleophilaceae bacterium]|jgi:hypothetical protein|nr:hypothetical protein [Thermoleophilaceae bacterium]
MSMLVWVIMAIAIWHFTIWLPDHFYGGIVGAFLAAVASSAVFGFLVSGLTIPGQNDTHLGQALIAVPGSLIGLGISYWYGLRLDSAGPQSA